MSRENRYGMRDLRHFMRDHMENRGPVHEINEQIFALFDKMNEYVDRGNRKRMGDFRSCIHESALFSVLTGLADEAREGGYLVLPELEQLRGGDESEASYSERNTEIVEALTSFDLALRDCGTKAHHDGRDDLLGIIDPILEQIHSVLLTSEQFEEAIAAKVQDARRWEEKLQADCRDNPNIREWAQHMCPWALEGNGAERENADSSLSQLRIMKAQLGEIDKMEVSVQDKVDLVSKQLVQIPTMEIPEGEERKLIKLFENKLCELIEEALRPSEQEQQRVADGLEQLQADAALFKYSSDQMSDSRAVAHYERMIEAAPVTSILVAIKTAIARDKRISRNREPGASGTRLHGLIEDKEKELRVSLFKRCMAKRCRASQDQGVAGQQKSVQDLVVEAYKEVIFLAESPIVLRAIKGAFSRDNAVNAHPTTATFVQSFGPTEARKELIRYVENRGIELQSQAASSSGNGASMRSSGNGASM